MPDPFLIRRARLAVAWTAGLPALRAATPGAACASSYPAGHDFWPGNLVSWILRGLVAFGAVNVVWIVALFAWRRRIHRARGLAALLLVLATLVDFVLVLAPSLANPSDGDKPVFIGIVWGMRVNVLAGFALWVWLARLVSPPTALKPGRGLPVGPPARPVDAHEPPSR